MIREVVVTTINAGGEPHIAPLGIIEEADGWVIAPFRPSTTLENLLAVPYAVVNYVDDPRIFAGLVTGRRDWPLEAAPRGRPPRLSAALSHAELHVLNVEDHKDRPRFHCRIERRQNHAPFKGFNRAANAVLEGAILITRLQLLPREKIDAEMAYLQIAIDKTAGPDEREAWGWLIEAKDKFYSLK